VHITTFKIISICICSRFNVWWFGHCPVCELRDRTWKLYYTAL